MDGVMARKSLLGLLWYILLSCFSHAFAADGRNLAVSQVNNAVSEKRIALVIGNGAYANSPLKNPINDAKDVAAKLRKLGFDVIERNNLQIRQIGETLREFRSKLIPGAVALVFYAGHGLQIKGYNYLPAVDAEINSEEDVPNQSLAVKQIMDVLDEAKTRLNLVFLDACRNNPYARSFRSAGQGLARITAPSGTLISYATRPGSVAADGSGHNGLYTSKLLAQMDSNLQIEQVLKHVVSEVKAASQGRQEPWMEGSIEGDFCFSGCAATNGGSAQIASIPVPAGADVSLDDIKKQQRARDQWGKWQADMKTDFDKIAALNVEPDLQIAAWERFLSSYAQDNPFSSEDNELRAQAKIKKQTAEKRKPYMVTTRPISNLSTQKGKHSMVKLQTNHGDITLELDAEKAPETVKNFLDYAGSGFYDGTIFHRVIDGFMIQGGGFEPGMKQKKVNAPIRNEAANGLKNDIYTVAMARTSDPQSATAQFFINVANNDFLNFTAPDPRGYGYCVFGKVVQGMDVVDKIKKVKTGNSGMHQNVPVEDVVITKATVAE